jgi:hypothetical protein
MKIYSISHYRDGGSVSILVSDINVEQLKTLGLPTEPKIIGDNPIYEIFRNFGINSKDKCKYFFGDINGEYKELFLDNPILLEVKKLLEQEKIKRGFYSIEKFLISL